MKQFVEKLVTWQTITKSQTWISKQGCNVLIQIGVATIIFQVSFGGEEVINFEVQSAKLYKEGLFHNYQSDTEEKINFSDCL